ncbi:MAG: hypothetical protein AB7O37_14635 [Vicinamibacteria bacterium]
MKTLFTITAVLTAFLGVTWLLMPEAMLGQWGVETDAVGVYMSRRYAGLFFGYSTIMWLSRGAAASQARGAVLAGGMVVTGAMTAISLYGVLAGLVGPVAWGTVVIEIGLVSGFAYFHFGAKK